MVLPAHGPERYLFWPLINSYLYPLGSVRVEVVVVPLEVDGFVEGEEDVLFVEGETGFVVEGKVGIVVEGEEVVVRYFMVPSELIT